MLKQKIQNALDQTLDDQLETILEILSPHEKTFRSGDMVAELEDVKSLIKGILSDDIQHSKPLEELITRLELLKDKLSLSLEEHQVQIEEKPSVDKKLELEQQRFVAAYGALSQVIEDLDTENTPKGDTQKHHPKGEKTMKLVTPQTDKMTTTETEIKGDTRVAEALSHMLASTYTLYMKSLFYHWNVTGPQFNGLHSLFEEHYENLHEAGDDIAERIRSLGHYTPGTLQSFSKMSKVQDDNELPKDANGMLQNLVEAHELCNQEARRVLNIAEAENDEVTIDMMVGRMEFHDKSKWMLSSSMS